MRFSRGWLTSILFVPPFLSLAYGVVSWLRYGIDLPFQDDWGEFRRGTAGSVALEDLFRPGGDTLFPVGKLLDALAQNVLHGHAVVYQLLSMIVILGLLLFFQWRLLRLVLADRDSALIAFVLTIFMLQPDTYWGRQNMGFHQAIPLVCVLASLNLALGWRWKDAWRVPVALGVSLIAGFSYISGAVAMLTTGGVLLAFGIFSGLSDARSIRAVAWSTLAGAAVALPAQLWVILGIHGGQTHRPDAPWTFPYDGDFWLFQLGMAARSLLLPTKAPALSMAIAGVLCIAVLAIGFWLVARLLRRRLQDPRLARLGLVYVALLATIGAYLCMVSAGRAGLRADSITSTSELFVSGFRRFYFAWVTLIWPWLAAAVLVLLPSRGDQRPPRLSAVKVVLPVVLVACTCAGVAGAFSHDAYYRKLNKAKVEEQVNCLHEQLRAGEGILCPRLHPGDLASAYIFADGIGASFVRDFPIPTVRLGVQDPALLFRLSTAETEDWQVKGLGGMSPGTEGLSFGASADSALLIKIDGTRALRDCLRLQAGIEIQAAESGAARVLFRRSGETTLGEVNAQSLASAGGSDASELYVVADSTSGFEPALELSAVGQPQTLKVQELEVRCLLWRR